MASYPINSRYYRTEQAIFEGGGNAPIKYLKRRFLPQLDTLSVLHEHTVIDGDRLDVIAARELGDPTMSWRIVDANLAMHPDELTAEPGRKLRITLPEGIPGF